MGVLLHARIETESIGRSGIWYRVASFDLDKDYELMRALGASSLVEQDWPRDAWGNAADDDELAHTNGGHRWSMGEYLKDIDVDRGPSVVWRSLLAAVEVLVAGGYTTRVLFWEM